jgi:hypothetical protein
MKENMHLVIYNKITYSNITPTTVHQCELTHYSTNRKRYQFNQISAINESLNTTNLCRHFTSHANYPTVLCTTN